MHPNAKTCNDNHGKQYAPSSADVLAHQKRQDTTRESAKVVYRDYDALQTTAWVVEGRQPVLVVDDAREDTLVISKQHCVVSGLPLESSLHPYNPPKAIWHVAMIAILVGRPGLKSPVR